MPRHETEQPPEWKGVELDAPRRRGVAIAAGLTSVALLGVVDHVTGAEIGISIVYLAPIGAAAWVAGRGPGLLLAFVAAAVWGYVDRLAGLRFSSPLIPVWNAFVRFGFFAITAWLIAHVRRMHARERLLARSDALTGVANTRSFLAAVDHEIARMRRSGTCLTLAYVDLDHFKAVNDTLGHAAGDELLRKVARRLADNLRAVDVLARLGGDEFALLLPDTDIAAASVALERCLGAIRAAVRETPDAPAEAGATVGAIVFHDAPSSAKAAIQAADDRMYQAKRAGRDRVFLAETDRPGTARAR